MNIQTKQELKGRKYVALRVVKGPSLEDTDKMRAELEKAIKGTPLTIKETDKSWELSNGQFFLKPVLPREKIGILDCTGSYATFDGVRIEYSDMEMNAYCGFETKKAQYAIHRIFNG